MNVSEIVDEVSFQFYSLPTGARTAIFVVLGALLTRWAVPMFEDEFVMALIYMVLAVFFFWMAIMPYI